MNFSEFLPCSDRILKGCFEYTGGVISDAHILMNERSAESVSMSMGMSLVKSGSIFSTFSLTLCLN